MGSVLVSSWMCLIDWLGFSLLCPLLHFIARWVWVWKILWIIFVGLFFDLKLAHAYRCVFCAGCKVSPGALGGEIWKGKEQPMETAARLESNSKALKPSLPAARSVWILCYAREDTADFIVWKGFILLAPREFEP